jgi:hypothetical protein
MPQFRRLALDAEDGLDVFGARVPVADPVDVAIRQFAVHEGQFRVGLRFGVFEIGGCLQGREGVAGRPGSEHFALAGAPAQSSPAIVLNSAWSLCRLGESMGLAPTTTAPAFTMSRILRSTATGMCWLLASRARTRKLMPVAVVMVPLAATFRRFRTASVLT